jgi:hypothetical protein
MTNGNGSQTGPQGRWGDYTMTTVDPADNRTIWHTNEYYTGTASVNWFTRVGKFQFPPPPEGYSDTETSPNAAAAAVDSAGLSGRSRNALTTGHAIDQNKTSKKS